MTSRRRRAAPRRAVVALVLVAVATMVGCGDGTHPFCGPLANMSDLDALAGALDADDLEAARAEAQRLRDLADDAPAEIRADLAALADAVIDIVELLEQERRAAPGDDGPGPGDEVGPAEVERRRESLNARLGEMDRRATRVSTWAARECGLDLG